MRLRLTPRLAALAAACAVAITALIATAPTSARTSTATDRSAAPVSATLAVGPPAAVAPTSATQSFLGIATELNTIPTLGGPAGDLDTPFVRLLRDLSPGAPLSLRLGGNSTDDSWWEIPGVEKPPYLYTLTPEWGTNVRALLTAVNAKAILGVNLMSNSAQIASAEVAGYEQTIGPGLIDAFELGNEPEFFPLSVPKGPGSHVSYRISHYGREFTSIASALGGAPLAGPGSGSDNWLPRLGTVLKDMPSSLKLVTVHAYPMKDCSKLTRLSVAQFFTPASVQGLADSVRSMVKAASAQGKPLRVDEINGVSCGGEAGVSNSFAEALWALNMLPAMWQAGVQGVNIQTIDGDLNQMITARHTASGWRVSVEPEYYGLLAFAQAVPAGSRLLRISDTDLAGIYQFAVRAPNGSERVILTNVGSSTRTLDVSIPGAHAPASLSRLTAKTLNATRGVTLSGQHLSALTGELAGAPRLGRVSPSSRGVYTVVLPANSAAILTIPA